MLSLSPLSFLPGGQVLYLTCHCLLELFQSFVQELLDLPFLPLSLSFDLDLVLVEQLCLHLVPLFIIHLFNSHLASFLARYVDRRVGIPTPQLHPLIKALSCRIVTPPQHLLLLCLLQGQLLLDFTDDLANCDVSTSRGVCLNVLLFTFLLDHL